MELVTKKKLALIAGRANIELAEEVAATLDETLLDANCAEFANGELHCKLESSVRGTDVFNIQSHTGHDGRSIHDSIMEHLIMVDAARRASAKRITVVMPFFGYARQDRKSEGREPITARMVATEGGLPLLGRVEIDRVATSLQDGPEYQASIQAQVEVRGGAVMTMSSMPSPCRTRSRRRRSSPQARALPVSASATRLPVALAVLGSARGD